MAIRSRLTGTPRSLAKARMRRSATIELRHQVRAAKMEMAGGGNGLEIDVLDGQLGVRAQNMEGGSLAIRPDSAASSPRSEPWGLRLRPLVSMP